MGTQQEYYEQILNPGKASLDKLYADKQQRTEQGITQYNSTIDQHVQAGIAGYQQRIDQAPLDALEQKEDNALREAINRKIVSENMANMGITDSGLNLTQQTALTLQRGKADTEVDQNTKEYVNQLQMAIDSVFLEGETKKTDYANTQRTADSDWYEASLLTLENSAREGAATMYAADQEAKTQYEKSRTEYAMSLIGKGVPSDLAQAEAYYYYPTGDEAFDKENAANYQTLSATYAEEEAQEAQRQLQQERNDDRQQYAMTLIENGVDSDLAWAEAYFYYPTGDEATDDKNAEVYKTLKQNAAQIKAAQEAQAAATIAAAHLGTQQKQSENITSYITKRMAEGVSYDVAAMEAYAVYGTGDEAVDTQYRNYVIAYQKAINMGYDEAYAESIAQSVVSGEKWDVATASADAAAVDLSTASKWDDATVGFWKDFGDFFDTKAGDATRASKWTLEQWETGVNNMYTKALTRIQKSYPNLSLAAQKYAAAQAVGNVVKTAATSNTSTGRIKDALYAVLGGGKAETEEYRAAMSAAGIPLNFANIDVD